MNNFPDIEQTQNKILEYFYKNRKLEYALENNGNNSKSCTVWSTVPGVAEYQFGAVLNRSVHVQDQHIVIWDVFNTGQFYVNTAVYDPITHFRGYFPVFYLYNMINQEMGVFDPTMVPKLGDQGLANVAGQPFVPQAQYIGEETYLYYRYTNAYYDGWAFNWASLFNAVSNDSQQSEDGADVNNGFQFALQGLDKDGNLLATDDNAAVKAVVKKLSENNSIASLSQQEWQTLVSAFGPNKNFQNVVQTISKIKKKSPHFFNVGNLGKGLNHPQDYFPPSEIPFPMDQPMDQNVRPQPICSHFTCVSETASINIISKDYSFANIPEKFSYCSHPIAEKSSNAVAFCAWPTVHHHRCPIYSPKIEIIENRSSLDSYGNFLYNFEVSLVTSSNLDETVVIRNLIDNQVVNTITYLNDDLKQDAITKSLKILDDLVLAWEDLPQDNKNVTLPQVQIKPKKASYILSLT